MVSQRAFLWISILRDATRRKTNWCYSHGPFDTVNHSLLVDKLHRNCIQERNKNRWIKKWLSHRTQTAALEGVRSWCTKRISSRSMSFSVLYKWYPWQRQIKSKTLRRCHSKVPSHKLKYRRLKSSKGSRPTSSIGIHWQMVFHPEKCQVSADHPATS